MELFAIHCTTCKARLVVKDESVIGDILGCPKCGSMVQIVPPPGWQRPSAEAAPPSGVISQPAPAAKTVSNSGQATQARSQPATAKAVPAASSQAKPAANQAAQPKTEEATSTIKKAAAVIPPALPPRQPAAKAVPETSAAAIPPVATGSEPALGATAETLAPSLFASLLSRARHDWMLLAGGLSGGVLLGGVVWLVVWMSAPNPTTVADRPQVAAPLVATSQPKLDTPTATATEPTPQLAPSETATEPLAAPTSDPQPPASVENLPATRAAPLTGEGENANETTAAEPTPTAVASESPAEPPTPALKLEPVPPSASASSAPAESSPSAGEDITGAAAAPLTEPSAESANPSAQNVDASELNVHEPTAAPAKLATAEIEKRLAVALERVEFAGVPLAQFTAFISDVTGVPVVLDDTALLDVGKNRKTPIDVKMTGTTAAAALRAASQHAGLVYTIEDGRILITAAKR